jgi:hypothetical protein
MSARDLQSILAQFRKGTYTNDPNDPNYPNHFNTIRQPNEPIEAVYPGTARNAGGLFSPKQMVNVIVTPTGYYVDTPSVQRVGPMARLAGGWLDRSGMTTPYVIPRDTAAVAEPRPNRIVIQAPSVPTVTARTDGYVGRPADLSAGDQLRNLGRMFRR